MTADEIIEKASGVDSHVRTTKRTPGWLGVSWLILRRRRKAPAMPCSAPVEPQEG